jgi:anti-sigma regulatory factor (Ser/Thr protein kinase)
MKTLGRIKALAELGNLSAVIDCSSASARAFGFPDDRVGQIELVVEEVVTNVCKYAGSGSPAEVEVACLAEEAAFLVEISDTGKPFDVTSLPDPDLDAPVEKRRIGGLGVYLIKKLASSVRYRREQGRNVLTMEFRKS